MISTAFKNTSYPRKFFYSFLLTAASLAILAYGLAFPTIRQIKELRANIISQKLDLEKKLSQDRNMSQLSEKLKKIEPQLDLLDSVFLSQNQDLEFITALEGLASRFQLSQQLALGMDKTVTNNGYYIVPATIDVSGSLGNVIDYLKALEKMKFYVNIEALDLSSATPGQSDASSAKYSLKISALTYWQ